MTIVLATTNIKKTSYGPTSHQLAAIAPNITMGILHAYIDGQGLPVDMIDSEVERHSIDDLIHEIENRGPKLVGLIAVSSNPTASTMSMIDIIQFFNQLKKQGPVGYKTFIYGGHPTVLPERSLRETSADFVVLGEGYAAVTELYEYINGKRGLRSIRGIGYFENGQYVQQDPLPLIELDRLPTIRWDKVNPTRYRAHNWHCFDSVHDRSPYAIIWTNMGCPYPCEFCCINNLFGKRTFRFRSMKNVVAEIDWLVNEFDVKNLKILDELFIIDHPRIDEFCDLLEERNYDLNIWCFARTDSVNPRILKRLKKVGLNWVAFGFESIDSRVLAAAKKGLKYDKIVKNYKEVIRWTRDAGIYICADIIVGLWEDDRQSVQNTVQFMKDNQFEWINLYPCFAYPGTPLYDRLVRKRSIQVPKNWKGYSLYGEDCKPLPTKYLSSAEVLKIRDEVFRKYYQDPDILNMLEQKFGVETRKHVQQMTAIPLKRRLIYQLGRTIA